MEEEQVVDVSDSILNSVKKLLGILPEYAEFDSDIIMNINSAISTLRQLGVGPQDELFFVTSAEDTYTSFLGEGNKETPMVKMYLFYKTKLGFDPPQSSLVAEALKGMVQETEWRLNAQVDPITTFEKGGEISK